MVRHLKIHAKSTETEGVVVVPSTAPTNPVPCLDTKERMFDKMTNLAASSQLAQAKEKTAIEALAPEDEAKMPQFIAEQLRYKCSLVDCNYITVDDCMLRHHIKALHDETSYYRYNYQNGCMDGFAIPVIVMFSEPGFNEIIYFQLSALPRHGSIRLSTSSFRKNWLPSEAPRCKAIQMSLLFIFSLSESGRGEAHAGETSGEEILRSHGPRAQRRVFCCGGTGTPTRMFIKNMEMWYLQ
ncbi:hypothetical protein RUM44_003043 [Polyplax serrata]|uniref:C2H2-type domain-containing protein n=1 Tax=Polyplax serrata TaxID=468196 RepID=A0ABR1AZ66_POLSC